MVGVAPERLKALVPVSAGCGLRWGEVIELRRKDIGPGCEIIYVVRGATHRKGEMSARLLRIRYRCCNGFVSHLGDTSNPEKNHRLEPNCQGRLRCPHPDRSGLAGSEIEGLTQIVNARMSVIDADVWFRLTRPG
jgi:hypothetical protein